MSVQVRVPTPLQKLTNNQPVVSIEAATIQNMVEVLDNQYPGMKSRLCDENGKLRRFVNFYVNDEDIRFQQNEETPLKDGDEVSIIPAIAGG